MADTTNPATVAEVAQTPAWYDQLSQQFGTQVGSALTTATGLRDNWYDQPMVAGFTPLQEQAQGMAPGAVGTWQPMMGKATSLMSGVGTWDPATMQAHVSPYTSGVVNEIARLGNQNLMENILPQVNSTFAGAGQFGSTRNADFTNRAVRDATQAIAGQQANALQNAYNQAAGDYLNWNNAAQSAATTYGNLGTTSAQQSWQDIANLYGIGTQQQQLTQTAMDKAYQDWLAQIQLPTSQMSELSKIMPQISELYKGAETQITTPTGSGGDLATLLAVLGGAIS